MAEKNLFLVQDDDRPLYVIAKDFTEAIEKWQKQIAKENEVDGELNSLAMYTPAMPTGVHKIADDDEVCRDFN